MRGKINGVTINFIQLRLMVVLLKIILNCDLKKKSHRCWLRGKGHTRELLTPVENCMGLLRMGTG